MRPSLALEGEVPVSGKMPLVGLESLAYVIAGVRLASELPVGMIGLRGVNGGWTFVEDWLV